MYLKNDTIKYQEKIISITRILEQAEILALNAQNNEIKAHILYFLGYFYYLGNDLLKAKDKLIKCLRIESSVNVDAQKFLNYIWDFNIKPFWWRWWWYSPLNNKRRRFVFICLLSIIFILFLFHPFISNWINKDLNWSVYTLFIIFLILILFFPSIESIRTREFDLKLQTPPTYGFVLSHPAFESKLNELESAKFPEEKQLGFKILT